MSIGRTPLANDAAKEMYANYAEYNKTVRTWFISFSFGTLTLFLTNPTLVIALKKTGHFSTLVLLLICGGIIQVVVALLNKFASWHMYYARHTKAPAPKFWAWHHGCVLD